MPTYSYACTECGHRFDAQQAFTDDALTQCPQCGGRLRKLFGNVGVVFKGSGFYRTDARAEGKRSGGPTRSGSTAGTGGSSGTTSRDAAAPSGTASGDAKPSGASAGATTGTATSSPASGGSAPAA